MSMREKLDLLERRRAESDLGGGASRLKAQHDRGRLSAREHLDVLLDDGSFTELDRFVAHRSTDFGLEQQHYDWAFVVRRECGGHDECHPA